MGESTNPPLTLPFQHSGNKNERITFTFSLGAVMIPWRFDPAAEDAHYLPVFPPFVSSAI